MPSQVVNRSCDGAEARQIWWASYLNTCTSTSVMPMVTCSFLCHGVMGGTGRAIGTMGIIVPLFLTF